VKQVDKWDFIKNVGMAAKGRSELLSHLDGHKLSLKKSILAKCYDCMGYYSDGKKSCENRSCPLFPFMPYRDTSQTDREPDKNG